MACTGRNLSGVLKMSWYEFETDCFDMIEEFPGDNELTSVALLVSIIILLPYDNDIIYNCIIFVFKWYII